ncbi:MAG TPA: chromate efflux transporter [Mucilaginibacter sp.]|jgi:chromate transporter|nr:chromate efflux transporter [Mucilaginibacter sp.]
MEKGNLKEIARVFLKLGFIGFGGPAVHIAMMEEEVVRKRQWFTHEHFLDLIGATNLIPGPNSTEMALHCGRERGGWRGLLIAGACFILPAVIITGLFAWAYQKYGQLPQVQPFIYGIKPAVIGVVVSLMITLGKKAIKNVRLLIIGLICAVLAILKVNDIFILFGAGFFAVALFYAEKRISTFNALAPLFFLPAATLSGNSSDLKVFWIFLKVGAILYGSGYVLFAFLDSELVKTGMLSRQTLVDAIAVGQFTPGPVFSSATFIGWQLGGLSGAVKATVGIFLPSFLFVGLLNPLIAFLRKSKAMSAFLDAVNVSAIALIVAVCAEMGRSSVYNWKTGLILAAGITATLLFKKLNSAFVIVGGAMVGYLLWLL